MGVSFKGLKQAATKFIDGAANKVFSNSVETISDLYDELVQNTPKDTGEAMASWNIDYDAPNPVNRKELAAPRNASAAEKSAKHTAIAAYQNSLKLQALSVYGRKTLTGSKLMITNGARHIRLLEYQGLSGQAPNGWIRVAVRKAAIRASRANIRPRLAKL